jgi:hypothetical protein
MACTIGHCLYPHDSCAPDAEGSCFLGPCDGQPSGPVCRCDATVLESVDGACELWANDEKQAAPSLCIAGTFPCDTLQCQRHAEICVETVGGPAGSGSTFECVAAARANNGCSGDIPDCDCIILEQLGCIQGAACDCTTDPEHNEHVVIAQP